MLSCFPKVPAALGFYVTHKSLFFPLHQILSAMILYSSAELNSTLPPKYILFSQHFTFVHVLTSPVISLPSSLPSESRGSAGTVHSTALQIMHDPPLPPPAPMKQMYWLKLAWLGFFVCFLGFFLHYDPIVSEFLRAEDRLVFLTSANIYFSK